MPRNRQCFHSRYLEIRLRSDHRLRVPVIGIEKLAEPVFAARVWRGRRHQRVGPDAIPPAVHAVSARKVDFGRRQRLFRDRLNTGHRRATTQRVRAVSTFRRTDITLVLRRVNCGLEDVELGLD